MSPARLPISMPSRLIFDVVMSSGSVTRSQPAFSNNDYLSLVGMLISVPHTAAPPPVVIP